MNIYIFGQTPFIIKLIIFTLLLLLFFDMPLFLDLLLSTWKSSREYLTNTVITPLITIS